MKNRLCEQSESYFDDDLTESERIDFESHLDSCERCQHELRELLNLQTTIQASFASITLRSTQTMGSSSDNSTNRILDISLDNTLPLTRTPDEEVPQNPKRGNRTMLILAAGLVLVVTIGLLANLGDTGTKTEVLRPSVSQTSEEAVLPTIRQVQFRPPVPTVELKGDAFGQELANTEDFVVYQVFPTVKFVAVDPD